MSDDILPPCTECGRASVTRDGRHWCRSCLMKWICRQTPIEFPRRFRTADQRQATDREPSPWNELNVRRMEDADND